MKFFQSRRNVVRLLSYLVAFCLLCGGAALVRSYQYHRVEDALAASSQRAMQELSESLQSITTDLQKAMYCNCASRMSDLTLNLRAGASLAKYSLAQLSNEALESDAIFKFLSQVGDFAHAVDKKLQASEPFGTRDRKSLTALYAYARTLTDAIAPLGKGYFDGTVTLAHTSLANLPTDDMQPALFSDEVNAAQQTLAEYPTLLYDGPFADARLNRDALAVKDLGDVTPDVAQTRAAAFLGCPESELKRENDVDGALALYCFSRVDKTVAVTRQGGLLCSITGPCETQEAAIDARAAVKIAKRFLKSAGYDQMRESYYSTFDGVCTVNFAFVQNRVVCYADLIKVSVALDTGAIVGVDARGYLMNHTARTFPEAALTREEVVARLAPNLTLLDAATAMIPCDDGNERLCYELHCTGEDAQQVLVYIDVQTGNEADIQLLTFSDGGVLAR